MIQIRVHWKNPHHELLRGAAATVSAPGPGGGETSLAPVVRRPGDVRFQIVEPYPPTLVVRVTVDVALPAGKAIRRAWTPVSGSICLADRWVEDRPAIPPTRVLDIEQRLTLDPGGTSYSPIWTKGPPRTHPLISVVTAANAKNAHVDLLAHLEFLDVSAIFKKVAPDMPPSGGRDRFGCATVVLASTAGRPVLWFTTIPPQGGQVVGGRHNALVFFRPETEPSSRLGDPFDAHRLERYLLAPTRSGRAPSDELIRTVIVDDDPNLRGRTSKDEPDQVLHDAVRVGMERALDAAARDGVGLRGVMVHPWPDRLDFGDACTSQLPRRLRELLRALWGYQHLLVEGETIDLGRLVLAGYSAGGGPLRDALAANRDLARFDEVWAFDAHALFLAAPLVKEWVDSSPGRRLRATYGEVANGTYLEALRRRIESSAPGAVVIAPAQPASWTVDVNQQQPSTWWGACIQDIHFWSALIAREAMAGKGGSRHAFAMFGGDGERPSNGGRTFFEDFLRSSSLHRPT